ELVPSPSVDVSLTVSPGDELTATVAVSGTSVTMTLADATTGKSFTKTVTVASPDTSSAEWIAEAPSSCGFGGRRCQTLALANFGTVAFTGAAATTSDGTTGTIGAPGWSANAIKLNGSSPLGLGRSRFAAIRGTVTATPGALSTDGSAFTVTYAQQPVSVSPPSPRPRRGRGRSPGRWGWGR
ncbi:MAG: G1 family glutamic endopeptidase, partial [Gaiellaceae bacterium]